MMVLGLGSLLINLGVLPIDSAAEGLGLLGAALTVKTRPGALMTIRTVPPAGMRMGDALRILGWTCCIQRSKRVCRC